MPNTRKKLIELCYKFHLDSNNHICDGCGSTSAECVCAEIADHLIANGVTVQEWISVKDRLPDLELVEAKAKANVCDSYVCLTAKRGFVNKDQIFITKAWYYGDRFENDDSIDITDDVTHWMPLPPAPEDAK